ncbi:MAG: hypothetical protein L6R28_15700 [Planctomycetes bacterium]|nr:hypothetical protein [Planctomycetota bacterium]
MNEALALSLSAAGLGLLTAVHPCPLAGHLGALAALSGWSGCPRRVWFAGLALAAGFAVAYAALGILLSWGLASAPYTSEVLRSYLTRLLGPFLVVAGMLMAGLLGGSGAPALRERVSAWLDRRAWGSWIAFPAGMLLALSFCPASAALFFGVLLPLALTKQMPVILPVAYGAGVALPLAAVAFFVAFGTQWLGRKSEREARTRTVRLAAGTVLILVGIAHALQHVYGIL